MSIEAKNIINHIAVIPDGNRRWAKRSGLTRLQGHIAGYKTITSITKAALQINLKYLTFFCFSTENQKRDEDEKTNLTALFKSSIKKDLKNLQKNGIKLNVIGTLSYFDQSIQDLITTALETTCNNDKLILTLALNYGSKSEIVHATKLIANKLNQGTIMEDQITEEFFGQHLYTKNLPPPDLMIRTGNESRLSNFLLWQMAYTELYFSDKFFPDFTIQDFYNTVEWYTQRTRRFGS